MTGTLAIVRNRVDSQLKILRDAAGLLEAPLNVLDLGCGNGDIVQEYRLRDYSAYGCDFVFKDGPNVERLRQQGWLRLIEADPYRLPFEDNTFDILLTDQVFEHVKDYPSTLAEIRRVMKPGGISLNIFPSRHTPLEPHVFVPYATIFQSPGWLLFWAKLGIRTRLQKGMPAHHVAKQNHDYLRDRTNYLTKPELRDRFSSYFDDVAFREDLFLKHSPRGKMFYDASRILPFLPAIYSALRCRVVFFRKPDLETSIAPALRFRSPETA